MVWKLAVFLTLLCRESSEFPSFQFVIDDIKIKERYALWEHKGVEFSRQHFIIVLLQLGYIQQPQSSHNSVIKQHIGQSALFDRERDFILYSLFEKYRQNS